MRYSIYAIAIMLSLVSFSQTCTTIFLGEITDFHDKTPIVGATVFIKNLNRYTTSDINGKFKIEQICNGQLTLEISHINCENKIVTYEVTGDTFKTIALEHHIEELNEVTVNSQVIKSTTKTAQESVIKEQILNRYSSQNLGDVLKEVAGVSSINTGNSIVKPMINGMHSSRLIILNNGVRLQDQEWGIEHAPNIDINAASQISVIKGSGALAYGGDAIGGVIVIKPTRAILKDTLYGKTIVGGQTNGRGYSVTSHLNKTFKTGWFINFQGTLKQNGDFEAPDYILTNTGSKSHSFTVNAGKKRFESGFELFYSLVDNEIGILESSHIGNVNDLINAINAKEPAVIRDFDYSINNPKQNVIHHLLKANYYKRFKNFGKISLQYDYQNNNRLEFDIRRGNLNDKAALNLTLQTHTLLTDVNLDSNLDRKVNFGVLARYQNNDAPNTGVRRLIPNYDRYDFGTYITSEWKMNDRLLLDAGLRYDFSRIDAKKFYRITRWEERGYDEDFADIIIPGDFGSDYLTNPVFDFHNISAAVGMRYDLNTNSYVLLNYNLASRPPNPAELFSDGLHHSAARIELGDLRFDPEIAHRFSFTYGYENSKFNLIFETFYNTIGNYMYLRPFSVQQSNRGAFPVWQYEQTDATLFGADVTMSYKLSDNFNLLNKTAFIKGYDNNEDLPLIDIPAFSTLNSITYTNKKWNGFSASIKSEWVFEQNEFPDFNFETFNPTTGENVLLDISTPPSAYNLFHFYSEATFNLNKKTNLNIAFGVNNLLNTSYRNYLNRLRFFADDLGRNITLRLQLNY